MKDSAKLDLTLDHYDDLNEFDIKCSSLIRSLGFSDEKVPASMAVLRELLKISMHYGKRSTSTDEISVHLKIDKNSYTIEVRQPVDETSRDRLKELDNTIQFIRGYQDPFEAYMLKNNEASDHFSYDATNGSDLARIAYEKNAIIDFFISEDKELILSAVSSLETGYFN